MQLSSMDAYYEQVVKRKMNSTTVSGLILGMILIVAVLVVSIWLSMTILSWLFPIALIMLGLGVYLIYYILKNSRVEYEYTFVIGELRVARIKGKSKRKTITYFDVKSIDDIDKFIDPETGKKNVDLGRFRVILHAAMDDHREDTYYMIIHDKVRRQPAVLLFTPNERTLEMIQPYFSVELKKKFLKRKKEQEQREKAAALTEKTVSDAASVPAGEKSFAEQEKKAEQAQNAELKAEKDAEKKAEKKPDPETKKPTDQTSAADNKESQNNKSKQNQSQNKNKNQNKNSGKKNAGQKGKKSGKK